MMKYLAISCDVIYALSCLEFLAGKMLLEIEFLEFGGKDFAFRSGFNQKLKNGLNKRNQELLQSLMVILTTCNINQ